MQLNRDASAIQAELKNPGNFAGVGITNTSNSEDGITVNSIIIELTNGQDLPADLNAFAKTKAKILADAVINKNDFASIEVKIISQSTSGMVTSSSSRTFDFSFADLAPENSEPIDSLHTDSVQTLDSSSLQ